MSYKFCALACVISSFLLSAVRAGELVVDTGASTASDQNPGTPAKPLKTISAAAAKVQAGDHVLIHEGTYRETVIITASGTAQNPIVFEAAPGEKPVIKGSDILEGWKKDEGQVWKVKLASLPAAVLGDKDPASWNTNDIRQIVTRDGELLDARRLRRVKARDGMQAGTFFCNTTESTLFVWLAESGSPNDHPLEVSRRGAWLCIYGSNVIVRGLAMRHSSTTAFADWPAANVYGENNTLEDCSITWGDFAGLSLYGRNNRLAQTLVACNGGCGAGGTGENHTIENCRFVFNNVDRYLPDWHAGGAKLIPAFNRSTVRHNEFAYNLGPGLWLDGGCNNNVVDSNYSHDNEGAGFMIEISTGNLVMNNTSVSNHNFLSGTYRSENGTESFVPNSENRVAPDRRFKLYHAGDGRGIYVSSSPDTKVVNNTAYLNEAEGIVVEGPPRGESTTGGALILNNISVFNHGSQLTIQPDPAKTNGLGNVCDYNMLFSVGAILAKNGWEGNPAYDVKQWQKMSGHDQHSLDSDPHFAMAAMGDFRLVPDSTALGAGKVLPEVDHDFVGAPRRGDTCSLGAFEIPADNTPSWNWPSWGPLSSVRDASAAQ